MSTIALHKHATTCTLYLVLRGVVQYLVTGNDVIRLCNVTLGDYTTPLHARLQHCMHGFSMQEVIYEYTYNLKREFCLRGAVAAQPAVTKLLTKTSGQVQ